MGQSNFLVHKFGGTSVANGQCLRKVFAILQNYSTHRCVVVLSAAKGITDLLLDAAHEACGQNANYKNKLLGFRKTYQDIIDGLINDDTARGSLTQRLHSDSQEIEEILRGVWLAKNLPTATLELVAGYGELWSAQIFTQVLQQAGMMAHFVDARQCIFVEKRDASCFVDWQKSQIAISAIQKNNPHGTFVCTGFIAADKTGLPTTLGRNGSDYSASIFGKLFKADEIIIWTDVDGVYTADPRQVPEAQLVNQLSYHEAMELAYFGAKVIHPHTMAPAIESRIPIRICNTFKPEAPGSLITQHVGNGQRLVVKGFSHVDNIALVNLEGPGMVGVPGVAHRLFGALKEVGVSVIMISQASSEHSICFAIHGRDADRAATAIGEIFFSEIHHNKILPPKIVQGCSILAAVGDNMVSEKGVAGKFFTSLGRAGVNVRAIAQGSSERNISVVVDTAAATRGLRAVHSAFYLSQLTISLGLIGAGLVGKTLLRQISKRQPYLQKEYGLNLQVRGIINSKKMWLAPVELDLQKWESEMAASAQTADLSNFLQTINSPDTPHSVIIDCTASEQIARHYGEWLERGIHVVTPNKKAGSADRETYQKVRRLSRMRRAQFYAEATVGAGLPIIATIRDLIETGDRVIKIEGVFSGTLSFIFNELQKGGSFSEVLKVARAKGFTEPDPREDLNGMDVARKVVILGREAAIDIDLVGLEIESLLPPELSAQLSIEEFMAEIKVVDQKIADRIAAARRQSRVLKYVGRVGDQGCAKVGMEEFPDSHPFARISGTDNIFAITTERYLQQPLIIQGPGAGPEVTAAGVFSDLLRLCENLGAKLNGNN